jgi:2-polyprenyl-3-methyl-5-hydroxy-6-metoxy-1,4-benzoquinol methylase
MDLVKQEYWDNSYKGLIINDIPSNNPIIDWIQTVASLCIDIDDECIEIGVFPGGFINEFGKLGYKISGIDLTPRIKELNDIFQQKKYNVGEFLQVDFFSYNSDKKYKIVYSIGFIEHFIDYKSVIIQHAKLVDMNGILLIIVPNFKGNIQYFLHRILDSKNLERHNIKSMDLNEWEETLVNNGFEILKKGYIGGFEFWMEIEKRNIFKIAIRRIFVRLAPFIGKILSKPSPSYSPYCGIIAKKIN